MKISVLCSARKESKFLAQFIAGYMTHTNDHENTELLVMHNAQDEWNKDLIEYFSDKIHFEQEDWGLGRRGLHLYFNHLLKYATGDWILYMCEDHVFKMRGWDDYLRDFIEQKRLYSNKVQVITPRFQISGAMVHIVSRAYVDVVGHLGDYGNIDSWFGTIVSGLPEGRNIDTGEIMFHDYTAEPDILSPDRGKTTTPPIRNLPAWESGLVQTKMRRDIEKLNKAIEKGL